MTTIVETDINYHQPCNSSNKKSSNNSDNVHVKTFRTDTNVLIIVIMYVNTFKTDAIVLISDFIMCVTSHRQIIFSFRVTSTILTISLCEIRGKMFKLHVYFVHRTLLLLHNSFGLCETSVPVFLRHQYIVHYCCYPSFLTRYQFSFSRFILRLFLLPSNNLITFEI